jgi:hypothetical protein
VRQFQTDGAPEFNSRAWNDVLQKFDIAPNRVSTPYVPEQNGVAERFWGVLIPMARALLHAANLDHRYFKDALRHACYLINLSATKANNGMTPYEKLTGRVPDLSHLRIFGSDAYALKNITQKGGKLDEVVIKGKLVGYGDAGIIANGVYVFYPKCALLRLPDGRLLQTASYRVDEAPGKCKDSHGNQPTLTPAAANPSTPVATAMFATPPLENIIVESAGPQPAPPQVMPDGPPSARLRSRDLARNATTGDLPTVNAIHTNLSVKEAMSGEHAPGYEKALQEEYDNLARKGVFIEMRRPRYARIFQAAPIFSVKYDNLGNITRYKARLVGRGYTQVEGIDYFDTFADVVHYDTLKTMLAIAAARNRRLFHLDFTAAYLNAPMEEDIYIEVPYGYKPTMEGDVVLKLAKSLYGFKQSGRNWRRHLHDWLIEYGFRNSEKDRCLYVLEGPDGNVLISIYVDDLLICDDADSPGICNQFMKDIEAVYETKISPPDNIESYLSTTLTRLPEGIVATPSKNIRELLERTHFTNCRPASTPMAENLRLEPASDADVLTPELMTFFRSIVGALMHITQWRPDIAYATHCLTHFMNKAAEPHLNAAKRVLRYLAGTVDLGLLFRAGQDIVLSAYVDSDYATDPTDRKSISGYVTKVAGSTVAARREKQEIVALSSTEAELIAATTAGKQILYLRQILKDMGYEQAGPTTLFEDNTGCINISENPVQHRRTKHIDVRYLWLRQGVENGDFKLNYIPSKENVADIMTKPLGVTAFTKLRAQLLGVA